MIDLGIDKLALIGAVALIVIGPERLPRVARTLGHLMGKAQRYVADVKAEVSRSMELEELQKMKSELETTARNIHQTVSSEIHQLGDELHSAWEPTVHTENTPDPLSGQSPIHQRPRKNWRIKRAALPYWYKQRHRIRSKVQSGAARVARFRPSHRRLPSQHS
ncbi:MAG: twin-arginine translocase TatA/TatE family subunit [Burkholderiales bacterium]